MHVHTLWPVAMFGEPQHNWSRRVLATQVVVQADRFDGLDSTEQVQSLVRSLRLGPTVRGGAFIVTPTTSCVDLAEHSLRPVLIFRAAHAYVV